MYSLGGLHNPMIGGLSYGAALILGIAHCINQTEKTKKLLMALVCLVIFVGVIYTGTRSAWVGVIFAVLTLIMFHPKLSLTKKENLPSPIYLGIHRCATHFVSTRTDRRIN